MPLESPRGLDGSLTSKELRHFVGQSLGALDVDMLRKFAAAVLCFALLPNTSGLRLQRNWHQSRKLVGAKGGEEERQEWLSDEFPRFACVMVLKAYRCVAAYIREKRGGASCFQRD